MDFHKAALGDELFWYCPSISLSAFLTKITMAAKALRHSGHPRASESS